MKKVILLLLAASVFIFTGCTKTGPPGPQGPQGPQGNANVIGSDPFTVSNWTYEAGINMYTATFQSNDITADIVDYGIVSLFKSYGTSSVPEWTPLPDINGYISTVFNFYDGGFKIYVQTSDGTVPPIPAVTTFRLVVISSSLREANPGTDWKNFQEVNAVLQHTQQQAAAN